MRIWMPMAMSMIPPMALILFPKTLAMVLPKKKPTQDNPKVTAPIAAMGVTMEVWRKAKLNPTMSASMLVATDNVKST